MKTERITLKSIPALLIGELPIRCISTSTEKWAAKRKLLHLQSGPARQVIRCWPSTCPNMASGRTARNGSCMGGRSGGAIYGSVCKSALAAGLAAGHEHRCVVFHAGVTGEGTAPCALRFAHRGYGRPHRQDDAAGQRDRRAAEGGRGASHNVRGDAFVAVSLLGAGASASLAHPHAGALWRSRRADFLCCA